MPYKSSPPQDDNKQQSHQTPLANWTMIERRKILPLFFGLLLT